MTSFYEEYRKKDIFSDEEENRISRANVDKWIFRLFLVLFGVMPLIVSAHVEEVVSPLISSTNALQSGVKGELFTHYKSLFVVIITIIVSLLFLAKIFFMNGTIRKTWLNYVLGTFVVTIIASTIMSPNITIALNGQYNRSDGAISWLCYVALLFIAMNIEYPKNVVRYIMYTMMPFVYINLIISAMNFYGKDLLQNQAWVAKFVMLTLPEGSNLNEGSQLLGTLNQWNYMSGMFAMMTVMYLAWAVVTKQTTEVVIGLITSVVSVTIVLMSLSTNGFITLLFVFIFIIWLAIKSFNKKQSLIILVIFVASMGGALHTLASKNERIWTESLGFFIQINPYTKDISSFNFELFEEKVFAAEETFELPQLPAQAWGPGTGRIYIWKETIELVKERPILGYGLDSLVYHFPHYQVEARGNLNEVTIVDKPHSVYVGVLYGIGIIGFILFIMLVVMLLKEIFFNIKNYNSDSVLSVLCLAFVVQALFNDTTPAMMCTFFIIAGKVLAKSTNLKKE